MSDRVIIAIHRDEVEAHGAQNAIVLQQIRHWADDAPNGWLTSTSEELAAKCGLSPQPTRRAVKYLIEAGLIEKQKLHLDGPSDHTLSFRPCGDIDQNRTVDFDHINHLSILNTSTTSLKEKTTTTAESPATKPKRKAPKAKPLAPLDEEAFGDWWKQYPRKASKSAARKAWHKIVDENQQEAVTFALENYIESLATYERLEHRPLDKSYQLHPSTFLNGAWEDWAEGVNLDRWAIAADQLVREDPNDQRLTNPHAFAPEWQPEDES